MNPDEYMIVDLEKRDKKEMFITESISYIKYNKNGLFTISFKNSPQRVFNYSINRLLYLKNPESINIEEKGVYINNKRINNVSKLLCFSNGTYCFFRIKYKKNNNEYSENIDGRHIYITRTNIDKISQEECSIWNYLRCLANERGLMNNGINTLEIQYNLIDVKRDNVPLAQYIGDKTKFATYSKPKQIYFPFGCNASQKNAVEAALTNQVSIIQGPPGTGKTQTILNIIANLIIREKTILVVSNNNLAVENIYEKLNKEDLGFLVARLGKLENKTNFIENQPEYPQNIKKWIINNINPIKDLAKQSLYNVSKGFNKQTRQSTLKAEYNALLKESKYNKMISNNSTEVKYLRGKSSNKLIKLLNQYKLTTNKKGYINIWFRLKWAYYLGLNMIKFLKMDSTYIIENIESAYYVNRKEEIEKELETISSTLKGIDIDRNIKELCNSSMQLLKNKIYKRYIRNTEKERIKFNTNNIKNQSEKFLKEYPIVLSTTYSSKNCINPDMVFDYVIMDEASQIDIKTGALALSCAINAVIVGDDKQLPNVVNNDEKEALIEIQNSFNIDDLSPYNAVYNSFLKSCKKIFTSSPVTLLREHYRCHPKIIEFCNQRFYNGELIAMTSDKMEENVLQAILTVPGNHARNKLNQREIDVIIKEVLPECNESENIGIITPYNEQADAINKALGKEIASTVHKYQGRECDTIIMSMVDNYPNEFSDDANLINVAVSRAKSKFYLVTNGNETNKDSNIKELIKYIQYNNFSIKESKLRSVFDLLYQQYTKERLEYEATHTSISEYLSENIIYNILSDSITELCLINVKILCHYPLYRIINKWELLKEDEKSFASNKLSHIDFLIYNSLTKQAICAIEVDGWHFHKNNNVRIYRDKIKDQILTTLGLKLLRISTKDTITRDTITNFLKEVCNNK